MNFKTQFENLKKLNLPKDYYMVVSSGALAVRGIRDCQDLDVIVTQSLWDQMSKEYPVEVNSNGIPCLDLGNDIEILDPARSIFCDSKIVPVAELFAEADEFDGIKFINLSHLKKIKEVMGREKDLADIALIDTYLSNAAGV